MCEPENPPPSRTMEIGGGLFCLGYVWLMLVTRSGNIWDSLSRGDFDLELDMVVWWREKK